LEGNYLDRILSILIWENNFLHVFVVVLNNIYTKNLVTPTLYHEGDWFQEGNP
jgi:hypothetical protein